MKNFLILILIFILITFLLSTPKKNSSVDENVLKKFKKFVKKYRENEYSFLGLKKKKIKLKKKKLKKK
jgi:uncharacterized membrane protein (DUF106 family)